MLVKEKEKLRKELLKDLEETEKDILYLIKESKAVQPDNAIGRISRMDAIHNMNINKSLLRKKEEHKYQLEEVLEKIDEKDFASCSRCKKDIPFLRILRVPNSKLCVPCIQSMKV